MTIAGELVNILGFKLEGEQNLKKFNQGMDDAEVSAKKTSDRVRALGIAAGAVATGAIAVGTTAVKNFAAFEREMGRIGTTAGATVAETVKASDDVQALSKRFALPLEEAVSGLDTLTASGMDLDQAMAFLPSVLATAQASGAAVSDIANTAQKASSALKIEAGDLQKAFDIMVSGGKAGQFELKDMAASIPTLANSFANLGYSGQEGLQKLIAILQTLREDTGSAGQAATQAQNIFAKMFSQETEKNFSDFGVNIRDEVDKAVKAGEGAIEAYVRISRRVMADNPTAKLVDLFADQEFQLGMQSLMTSADSYEKFLNAVNGGEVDGTVFRDLERFTTDTTASIQRLSSSWDSFMKSLGGAIAPTASGALDKLTNEISYQDAVSKELEKQGYSFLGRQLWMGSKEQKDALARAGGYVPNNDPIAQEAAKSTPAAYKALGRRPSRPMSKTPDTAYGYNEPAQKELPANVFAGFEARMDKLAAVATSTPPEVNNTVNDSRDQSTVVNVGGVVVNGVPNVSAAVGGAVGRAVGQAAVGRASRFEKDDAF
ncbi:phage tail tape measure protein [Agrobacterium tumefaciens]|uniref:Phage tail tape measure protein n=1 Tax=Agrobacterium tumefaciens TaxID=358 RepID=A0AAP9J5Q4_AGRTU|nr:phage tail tape measure protein [Agrobacterium tumefaciens]NSZ57766.1 phage tail tape measure protein [Agrobacterium tumefaciens]QDY93885.1 phage tail tape measure protein [Agrobacterium tumefaciens]UXS48957.1 phage tail tape measure protein [Agrobacterium tumefaciens]UXS70261.1 phage tail tape measure protein [Agrobacterium tumefaciens]UXS77924.1 phage tail tape measure protein [Agrobacterium tumefaciens]